ncbi:MGDG synthase family glycosyltransferase [Paenibacillus kobensis]|uniref:MGDG synthase family glycosyltransferase n=1 Tax=Paenibacillus kobensis TaxID=59841 RepID=UPI0013E3CA73|nr:glycosyltransferase [Paenibacillus kobensis]
MHSPQIRKPGLIRAAASETSVRRDPKLLIIYASYGDGHLQAARAIREALELQGVPSHCVKLIDIMAKASPLLNEVTRRFYTRSYSMMPSLYGWVYDRTRPMKHDSLFGGWLHSFGKDTMRRLLLAEQPDAVIYTFPAFAAPSNRRRSRLPRVPAMAVVTDFDLHCRWVHPHVDRYYVATNDLKAELVKLGVASRRIIVSGIPVKRGFTHFAADHALLPSRDLSLPPKPITDLYRQYNIPEDRPLVLIMAGAQGVMPDVSAICSALLRHPDLSIALVCGRNTALADMMRERFLSSPSAENGFDRLHIFGFVEPIHELMALADCLITKPGGITLSEGLAAGLPLFIYRPVPGQERNNALYLQSQSAAFITHHPEELSNAVQSLLSNPERLQFTQAASAALGRSGAADSIALDILSQCPIMELEETSSTSHIEGANCRDR